MTSFKLLLFLLICFFPVTLSGQAETNPQEEEPSNPYREGRWLAGISGAINSSNAARGFSEADTASFNNGHLVNLQMGYFVKDQLPLGIFVASRSQNSFEQFERDSETFSIGLWARYFLIPGNATLYPEASIFYTHFFNRNQLVNDFIPEIDTTIDGDGYGAALGLGFSYTMADLLIFDLGLNYSLFRIRGDLVDNIRDTSEKRSFSAQEVNFTFGFKVLIRK